MRQITQQDFQRLYKERKLTSWSITSKKKKSKRKKYYISEDQYEILYMQKPN